MLACGSNGGNIDSEMLWRSAIAFLSFALAGQAQPRTIRITGRTIDMAGVPIPDVKVTFDGSDAVSNPHGEFALVSSGSSGHFVLRFASREWRTPDILITKSPSGKDIELGNVFMEASVEDVTVHGGGCCVDQIHFSVPQTLEFGRPHEIQSASARNGNIYLNTSDGQTIWITSSGLDSDPSLSHDKRLVVFVRKSTSPQIDTGLGATDKNELWIADISGQEKPRRVLVGHPGGRDADENVVLAGFTKPKFSPDTHRIYFQTQTWTTDHSARVLDLDSGEVRLPKDVN